MKCTIVTCVGLRIPERTGWAAQDRRESKLEADGRFSSALYREDRGVTRFLESLPLVSEVEPSAKSLALVEGRRPLFVGVRLVGPVARGEGHRFPEAGAALKRPKHCSSAWDARSASPIGA